jgi:integrase
MELAIRPTKKNGKKIWRFRYYGLDGQVKFLSDKSKSALEVLAKEKINEIGLTKTSSSQIFLSEAWIDFCQHLDYKISVGKMAKGTKDDYMSFYLNHIIIFFTNSDIRLIDKHKIHSFIEYLKGKIRDKQFNSNTARKIFNTMSLILEHQVDIDKLGRNVCDDKNFLKTVIAPKKKVVTIDFDEWSLELIANIIQDINRPMVRLMCQIMLETAARPSEVRALDRKSLLFKSNVPMIRIDKAVKKGKHIGTTKTENGVRTLAISTKLKDLISDYVNKLPSHQNNLFLNNKGKFICVEQIIRGLERALAKNKVQLPIDRKSYFFRHYTATYWAYTKKHKENAIDLARDLGDKDINFVYENYIKPFKNNANAVENIEYQNKHFNWS